VIDPFRRALVLAPHTDDGELGCGGTIARLVEAGAEVHYMAFSSASRSLPDGFPADTLVHEVRAATSELGIPESGLTVHDFEVRTFPTVRQEILELLVAANAELTPDLVLMPSLGDIHQDHETIAREGMRAFKRTTLLGYEIPWNCFQFNRQAYVPLEARHLERKLAAVRHYASQQHRNYANEDYIQNLARTHGIECGRELAEVFEVYRWVI
jgi:N-acetylglucosamine malate deacetylase 1